MGYYTDFTLKTYPHEMLEIAKLHASIFDQDNYMHEFLDYPDNYNAKWYDHDEDFCKLSEMLPDVLFELFGVGEEFPDAWKKYYKNGKLLCTVNAEILYNIPFYIQEVINGNFAN